MNWGYHGTKTVEQLFWEAYQQRGCVIIAAPGSSQIKRVTRMVKINILAEVLGVDHTLHSRIQFMHDGQAIERRQVPLQKLRWNNLGEHDIQEWREEFSA